MHKLLIFRYATAYGGAEKYVSNLLAGFEHRVEVKVITNSEKLAIEVRTLGYEAELFSWCPEPFGRRGTVRLFLLGWIESIRFKKKIDRYFEGSEGVVFCHSYSDKLLAARAIHKNKKISLFWLEHGKVFGTHVKNMFAIEKYKKCSKRVDKIICVSKSCLENIASVGVSEDKLVVIYNGVDIIYQTKRTVNAEPVLLTLSRLTPDKGIDKLISAISSISHLSWKLVIAGEGPEMDKLKQLSVNLGLEKRVTFLGFVENVNDLISSSDIIVNPTVNESEGLPFVNIEALAAGKLLVSSLSGGAAETVEHNVTGIAMNPTDTENLTNALKEAVSNSVLRDKLSIAGHEFWKQNFSKAEMVRKTLDTIFPNRINKEAKV